jgi:hypothetical protein
MDDRDIAKLLSIDSIRGITNSRRASGIETLCIDGRTANVCKQLGSGGSKEVYDVTVDGEHFALALSKTNGFTEDKVIEAWSQVLNEPVNTDRLRGLGFYVNNLCKVVPVTVNGYGFPGLLMIRYSDHDFSIYDSKNPQGRYHELIKPEAQVTDEEALQLFAPIGIEILRLVQNGAQLGRDCFNLCDVSGVPHLYFNDLGHVAFETISRGDSEAYVNEYVSAAIGAFVNTVSERTYQRNPYVNSMGDIGSSLKPKLVRRVMETIEN